MNDYGEIIRLPYKVEDIYEPLKKLLKYDKIKPMILKTEDKDKKTFDLIAKGRLIFNENVCIKITEHEEMTEIMVYSKSKIFMPFDFGKNKRNVKIIVNTILKELSNCENTSDEFSIEIMKTYKFSKGFLHFILAMIAFYYLLSWIFALMNITDNMESEARIAAIITFTLITTIIYKISRLIKIKRYKYKRIRKIKSMLYDLIEKKTKTDKTENTLSETNNSSPQTVIQNIKPQINKYVDYIKKTKEEKPKLFWTITISIATIFSWIIISPFFTSKNLEGEYIQQMGRLSGEYSSAFAHSIKFSNGKAAMAGQGQSYSSAPWFEYKIKGNKIYVIKNGEEVDTEFKIKNNNTLTYGDGVIDKYCPESGISGLNLVCGPNFDGTYVKN